MLRTLWFYFRVLLVGSWFFFGTFVSTCMLAVRWKDPSMGAVLGRIVNWGGMKLLRLKNRIENQKALYLHQPCIYVGNHQSNLDIITMGIIYPYRTVVIGKKELRWMPLFGLFFTGSGMIMIDRSNRAHSMAGLEQAKEQMLAEGKSVWIFPEGTRNRGKTALLPFKKGAFHLAIAAQVPIVPIVHQHLYSYFDVEHRKVLRGNGEILARVLDPIPTAGMTSDDTTRLMELVRERMLKAMEAPELKFPREALEAARQGKTKADLLAQHGA